MEHNIDEDVEENKELYEALADGNDETIDSDEIVATLDDEKEYDEQPVDSEDEETEE
jgi:hypothetical protein